MNNMEFTWTGSSFDPLPRFEKRCDEEYVVGQRYRLEATEPRSIETHNHFFACVSDAWSNLPDHLADEFPSPSHLRAWGLIKAGFADKTVIKCASNDDAISAAKEFKKGEKIKIVEVSGRIVTVWTPHSQSKKAMGAARFQQSKTAVLQAIAELIGVPADEFGKAA
jgi:hypothetical protein